MHPRDVILRTFGLGGEICRAGVINLVALACVLRATTKKVVNFLRKKVHPRENPDYPYGGGSRGKVIMVFS